MIVAGEPSGDLLAADLVRALREELPAAEHDGSAGQPLRASLEPGFFGAGGPAMAAAGVELLFDLTQHAVTGLDALKRIFTFRRLLLRLADAAVERQPHAIICVDYSGFNLRLARAIRHKAKRRLGTFGNWNPKIIQYVSPQVWASRAGRAQKLAQNVDLLLTIFPFEKDWYAKRAPGLNVEFVGHPIIDRYAEFRADKLSALQAEPEKLVVFLPGSRVGELRRHVPVMGETARLLDKVRKAMVLPNAELAAFARTLLQAGSDVQTQTGGLPELLSRADLAIAATGTVTMECAYFGVPTVAMYKTSSITYQIGKRIIAVPYLAMPNLLAGQALFPEFVQDAATPRNLALAATDLLSDERRRMEIRKNLGDIIAALGQPGASRRAARAIISVLSGRAGAVNT